MVVYKKRVSTKDPRFHNRETIFKTYNTTEDLLKDINPATVDRTPISDTEVICNGCNGNIHSEEKETFGWLIYFDKRDVKADRPYDIYCDDCTERGFSDAVEVK